MHLVSALQLVREELNAESFDLVQSLPEFQELANLYEQYCKDENDGPLKMFWNSYLEMVATLLSLIRATREGNWQLHLECIKAMLPWFFAYDHTNYARYLPVYLVHMLELPDKHPEAYSMLSQGDFGVQRTTSHGFSQKPESTVVPASSHPCCPTEASTTLKLPSLCLEACTGCANSKPRTRWSRMAN